MGLSRSVFEIDWTKIAKKFSRPYILRPRWRGSP